MNFTEISPGMIVRVCADHPLAGKTGKVVRVESSHVWVMLDDGRQTPLLLSQVDLVREPQPAQG